VRGIPGLRAVNYTKTTDSYEYNGKGYAPVEQYVLVSDGSNYLEILTHPDVDATKVVSSDIHDMLNNLGIEATRATLFKEIDTLFKESGSSVNYRHVGLLLDKMCHKGRIMSIDRYGINKNDIGPLAKMSFEQTEDIALRAAIFGERDPVLGVSAKVMLGAPIRAGTAFSEILFDEVSAIRLAESTPEQRPSAPQGPLGYSEEEMDAMLYDEDDAGECSIAELRMPGGIPPSTMAPIAEEEADVDIAIIE
jgi:DNA-directed RNA polymerase II subunit RPB1